ncbi:uncharacterized protein C4orf51 homolog [Anolis carolinensis]|uniref:uncharacterized protein C4orf51 homolog n=1 Tax=Anolis carolinensis TaxID=28377 RepID=UPI000203979C|nr:PREDICTED: uncharacterized protein C4orf51 homolog [Anolis carolinensis]|eukprot:XP_003221711.1 PREDICTED: uncharacterized protein C4orf51 homolog [Anolis carolinensis]
MARYLFLVPGFSLPFSPLAPEAFEEIKCLAGQAWKQRIQENAKGSTTYAGAYGNNGPDALPVRSCVIPSSPTRAHKPHPTEIFLINQLHHLPGPYGIPKRREAAHFGFCPREVKKFQVSPNKVKYKAAAVASPVTPLDVIQQRIKHGNLNVIAGSQSGEGKKLISSSSEDMLTGWPVKENDHPIEVPTGREAEA